MFNSTTKKVQAGRGFTLIELLIVIGIIAILAAIVIVAINPSRQFAQARNTQRESNVSTILNAIGQNIADNKGVFTCAGIGDPIPNVDPVDLTGAGDPIGKTKVDLDDCLVPTYIPTSIPVDPNGTSDENNTGYTVQVDDVGRYTVCAPDHEETPIEGSIEYCLTR